MDGFPRIFLLHTFFLQQHHSSHMNASHDQAQGQGYARINLFVLFTILPCRPQLTQNDKNDLKETSLDHF